MNLIEAISWLENRPRFKDKISLKKMEDLNKRLGSPDQSFKSIHITGTNGKGSTAHFLGGILKNKYKVGLFTSPYILKFNERLQINDEMISDEKLLNYILKMKEFIENYEKEIDDKFTFFELLTIISFQYFKDEKVDYAIIEVGIGGKLDSTNIITPELAIITSLGKDHEIQLGNSLESILDNKLGIVKNNIPLFTAVRNFDEQINAHVKNMKTTVEYVSFDEVVIKNEFPLEFSYQKNIYKPKMQGLFQITNALLAIKAAKKIDGSLTDEQLISGINSSYNPGRFDLIKQNPFVILDGAHNKEAMIALKDSVRSIFKKEKVKILFACMDDKPFDEMIEILKTMGNEIILTEIDYHRAYKVSNMNKHLKKFSDPLKAYQEVSNNLKEDEVLIITGSLYFVSFMKNNL